MYMYVKMNEHQLIVYLVSKLGEEAIIKPEYEPDNTYGYKIYKNMLMKLFKRGDEYIDNIIEETSRKWSNVVPLDKLVSFLRKDAILMNQGKYTQGQYHIYMDMIHALYDIKCNHLYDIKKDGLGLPNYEPIKRNDFKIHEQIFPKRCEYLFSWWIMNITREFVKKYNYDIDVSFQVHIEGKVYDIILKPFNIIIEYQESAANHTNKESDKDKQAIIRGQAMIIEYFQESEYKKTGMQYLREFWENRLKKRIIEHLIKDKKNNDFIEDYIFEKFTDIMKDKRNELRKTLKVCVHDEKQHIENRINQIDAVLKGNNAMIKQIFSWKDKEKRAIRNGERIFEISAEHIAGLLRQYSKDSTELIKKHMQILAVGKTKGKQIYTDWDGLITFMIMVDSTIPIDPIVKRTVTDYLLNIQKIYDEAIIDVLNNHYKELLENVLSDVDRREDCIREKLEQKYERSIQNLSEKNAESNQIKKDLKKTIRSLLTKFETINNEMKYYENDKKKKHITKILQTKKDVEDILVKFEENEVKDYEIVHVFEHGKPIIAGIPDIIYTKNDSCKVTALELKSYFERHKIPAPTIMLRKITKRMCPTASMLEVYTNIRIIEFSDDDDDYEEESEEESDSSTNTDCDSSSHDSSSETEDDSYVNIGI